MRASIIAMFLLGGVLTPCASPCASLERGTAITDPAILRELDLGTQHPNSTGLGLGQLFNPGGDGTASLTNDALFALPILVPVRKAIDAEFDRYVARQQLDAAHDRIGVGTIYDVQLFDRALLYSSQSRFVLAGIVNRMDRAYVTPDSCGEIRLIYRLARTSGVETEERAVASPRLPMTLNVILKAKSASAPVAITCAEIARRWLAVSDVSQTAVELATKLTAPGGALEFIGSGDIDLIETNLQIAHMPKSATREFRTDYLLKVFRLNTQSKRFVEAPLENQIDRDRLLADADLRRDLKNWLLDATHLVEFDRGTVLIPEKFLATGAVAPTPAGFASSRLQPAFGLMQGDDVHATFEDRDVVAALKRATDRGIVLQNIRSPAGFARRLNDITCSGCHQIRGIGGFHFPGVDWMATKPSNATVVPGSLHFFSDQVRRRDILTAFATGNHPDFSRGFSDRAQLRGSKEFVGTEYDDGWGAHCYRPASKRDVGDPSFSAWTCAKDLACQPVGKGGASPFGMCFVGNR